MGVGVVHDETLAGASIAHLEGARFAARTMRDEAVAARAVGGDEMLGTWETIL